MEVRQEVRLSIVNANRKQRNQLPCFGGRFEMSSSSFVNIVFLFYFSYRLQARIKTTPFQATGFELCTTVFIRVNIILAVLAWEVCHYRSFDGKTRQKASS